MNHKTTLRLVLSAGLLALSNNFLIAQNTDNSLPSTRKDRLRQHLYYLTSDSLRGRGSGTEDAHKAAAYIQAQYEAMGLEPYEGRWQHPFEERGIDTYLNIVGIIPGCDPVLKDEYIVLGAHYDHLGVKNDTIYNGADDNASGSSALIEIARELCSHREALKRSIIIAAFDGEELGLFGSNHLSDSLQNAGLDIRLMMSIDMVGWLAKSGKLTLEGSGTIKQGKEILTETADALTLPVKLKGFESSLLTATDTEGFATKGIPTLAVSTGLKSPYHKPGDDAWLIDYSGLDVITQYITDITTRFAADEAFGPSGRLSFKHRQREANGVEVGFAADYNTSSMHYTRASFEGKSYYGWNGGLTLRASLKHVGLIADFLYDSYITPLPDKYNLYDGWLAWKHQAITVPVNIVYQTPRDKRAGAFIGAGLYYSRTQKDQLSELRRSWTSRESEVGASWCFGFDIYDLTIKDTFLMGFGNALSGEDAPSPAHFRAAICSVCWYF